MRSASSNQQRTVRRLFDVSTFIAYCFAAFLGCFFANNAQTIFYATEPTANHAMSLFTNSHTDGIPIPSSNHGNNMNQKAGGGASSASLLSSSSSSSCVTWEFAAKVQKQVQHDYCLRHFTGEPRRDDMRKVKMNGPDDSKLDFFIYNAGCYISKHIVRDGAWEPEMSQDLVKAMQKASKFLGVAKEDLHFMDIGGNMGVHTTYVRAAGYPTVTFEPLPNNEDLIRSNLCSNDPDQRGILFTRALGSEPMVCDMYSALPDAYIPNKGNGIVSCDGTVPSHFDGKVTFRGKMEVVRLDDVIVCDDESSQLPFTFGALKLDAEGFEAKVIDGGSNFFKQAKIPFIVFEIAIMTADDKARVLGYFEDLGYKASSKSFSDLNRTLPRQVPQNEANVYLSLVPDEILKD